MALKTERQSLVFPKISFLWGFCKMRENNSLYCFRWLAGYIQYKLILIRCAIRKNILTHTRTHTYTHSKRNPPNVKQNPDLNFNQISFIYCGELVFLYTFSWLNSSFSSFHHYFIGLFHKRHWNGQRTLPQS